MVTRKYRELVRKTGSSFRYYESRRPPMQPPDCGRGGQLAKNRLSVALSRLSVNDQVGFNRTAQMCSTCAPLVLATYFFNDLRGMAVHRKPLLSESPKLAAWRRDRTLKAVAQPAVFTMYLSRSPHSFSSTYTRSCGLRVGLRASHPAVIVLQVNHSRRRVLCSRSSQVLIRVTWRRGRDSNPGYRC